MRLNRARDFLGSSVSQLDSLVAASNVALNSTTFRPRTKLSPTSLSSLSNPRRGHHYGPWSILEAIASTGRGSIFWGRESKVVAAKT